MPERQKRVTLKDVADYCGLSRSLVAFIISNSGYRNSTPENRRKVAEAVKALNYRPNTAARELRARKSSTIGVAMPMSGTGIYGNMALELQREIKKRGFTSLFPSGAAMIRRSCTRRRFRLFLNAASAG